MLSDKPGPRARARSRLGPVAIAVAVCAVLPGCTAADETDGDCVGRVRLDGVLYEPRYDVTLAPAAVGGPLGRADRVAVRHGRLPYDRR
ncbi:hypothetical protein [Nocardioides aquiterrae]|uniref:Uncharacterized protein n=1 Tax=Nocardioides aquiterrae TaxID=203799 RepID=A0ABN1UCJ4_9ACTN